MNIVYLNNIYNTKRACDASSFGDTVFCRWHDQDSRKSQDKMVVSTASSLQQQNVSPLSRQTTDTITTATTTSESKKGRLRVFRKQKMGWIALVCCLSAFYFICFERQTTVIATLRQKEEDQQIVKTSASANVSSSSGNGQPDITIKPQESSRIDPSSVSSGGSSNSSSLTLSTREKIENVSATIDSNSNSNVSPSSDRNYLELCDNSNATIQVYAMEPTKTEPILLGNTSGQGKPRIVLEQPTGPCGMLRREKYWISSNDRREILTPVAQMIHDWMNNCSRPVAIHRIRARSGVNAHVSIWGNVVCIASHNQGYRVQSVSHDRWWIWGDLSYCMHSVFANNSKIIASPWHCYFENVERRCPEDPVYHQSQIFDHPNKNDPFWKDFHFFNDATREKCRFLFNNTTDWYQQSVLYQRAVVEYLFHNNASPLLLREAQRQVGLIFADNNFTAPEDLIVVHIRWGDKYREMKLVPIQNYTTAVKNLLIEKTGQHTTGNIFLATEDPRAVQEFERDMKERLNVTTWKLYRDRGMVEFQKLRPKTRHADYAMKSTMRSMGRMGLVSIASMLVLMEANWFVLTTKSGYSRLIQGLLVNVVDRHCGNCTTVVDLLPARS